MTPDMSTKVAVRRFPAHISPIDPFSEKVTTFIVIFISRLGIKLSLDDRVVRADIREPLSHTDARSVSEVTRTNDSIRDESADFVPCLSVTDRVVEAP